MALPQNFETITAAHLNQLIAEQASETQYLEFKRDLPTRDNAGRHEFVADISALANSTGGDFIYGLDEDGEGRASAIVAQLGNPDDDVRRLQDVLMNSVEPRIPGVQIRSLEVPDGFAVVVRVPQSWAGPHRVSTNQHFFVREGARKRQLNVPEIRSLFVRSDHQAQKVRDFRTERLGKLMVGNAPCQLVPGPMLVLHFVPTQAALGLAQIDPVQYLRGRDLPALGAFAPHSRINLDGILRMRNIGAQGTHGYSLFYRNGFFEALQVHTVGDEGYAVLGSTAYEIAVVNLHRLLREELIRLGAGAEMTCMLSLVHAQQLELGIARMDRFNFDITDEQGKFDRDIIVIPDILLPGDVDSAVALKPVFDMVWQAAGMEGSLNYDAEGNWQPRR